MLDLTKAVVVSPPPEPCGRAGKAIAVLVEEVQRRTNVSWVNTHSWPSGQSPMVVVGEVEALRAIAGDCLDEALEDVASLTPEGFRIWAGEDRGNPTVIVTGHDFRGVLFGVGRLLRELRMEQGKIGLPCGFTVTSAPRYRLRGHQLGYRDKTNSYCAWDLGQWDQYIRDLSVFGANSIELIPPRCDDKPDSVHFPLPPMETMEAMSRIADEYDMDVWIWYPAMDDDYTDPETQEFALGEWGEVFRRLPRINAVFVPGGDPGRTRPSTLMTLLERQAKSLRSHHPRAEVWFSPQGFSDEWMDEFIGILNGGGAEWLDGVVFGPWIHMSMEEFRELVPERYPIRHYPDITHTLSSQYPVPEWDAAYAVTEGREIINPRPLGQAEIFRRTQGPTIGFLTYSEGCHDDVNKAVWSSLGWDPELDPVEVLRQYSRYFIGERYTQEFAEGLLALERNWQGSLAGNAGVYETLRDFQKMEGEASPRDLRNWRFQQALYRAYYDGFVRSRLLYETELEDRAMAELRQAPLVGAAAAMKEAENILNVPASEGVSAEWRTRVFQLAEALFQSIGMQLSVGLYRAQAEVRGANLDGIDFPLNNGPWLKERFAEIRKLDDEDRKLSAIEALIEWTNPGPGGFYDCPVTSYHNPRFVAGGEHDVGFWRTPFRQYPYMKNPETLRFAWRGTFGTLKDTPLEMRYTELDPDTRYRVRIIYPDASRVRVSLEANGVQIHPLLERDQPRRALEHDVPREATRTGNLHLRWRREPGLGGAGRGCELSEVWLVRRTD